MRLLYVLTGLLFFACTDVMRKEDHQIFEVLRTTTAITIDGKEEEAAWEHTSWNPLSHAWKGMGSEGQDLKGRYKILWEPGGLYLLVEMVDDSLFHYTEDPMKLWWIEDALLVYVDEDNSGGLHQYNDNAYAYHVSPDGNVVDLGPERKPLLYNDHLQVVCKAREHSIIWEIKLELFQEGSGSKVPLAQGKKIGFALGYADNDGGNEVEHVLGSVHIPGPNKDLGWINADVFGTLVLVD